MNLSSEDKQLLQELCEQQGVSHTKVLRLLNTVDTEIDKDYYRTLKPHLSGAASLVFDQRQELTTFKEGYFWEK